ncbi:MAG TPA: hypothetical protein VNV60_04145 [Holophagaceae bacterium]|jgi:hypothetical protein|nr:hypothetical protein [Holophagaceae bacterium]
MNQYPRQTPPQTFVRRLAGLLAGWLACVFLVAAADSTIRQSPVALPAAWINLGAVFLAALAGGYICALIAKDRMIPRVLIAIVLFSGLAYGVSSAAEPGSQPVLLAILGAAGVYLGAWMKEG